MSRTLSDIADQHYAWLCEMGWGECDRPLEKLMLVVSEVGEAANECRVDPPTPAFGSELADIVLRTMGIAKARGIDLEAEIVAKMAANAKRGTLGRTK